MYRFSNAYQCYRYLGVLAFCLWGEGTSEATVRVDEFTNKKSSVFR